MIFIMDIGDTIWSTTWKVKKDNLFVFIDADHVNSILRSAAQRSAQAREIQVKYEKINQGRVWTAI